MLLEMGLIGAGIPLGWLLRKSKAAQAVVGQSLSWSVRLLLLFLGMSLGANELLLAQLESLGLRAAVISLCAVTGSLVCAKLLDKVLVLGDRS